MKIIFHIGMGKTGTTSIQRALRQNADTLKEQRAHYLGMWFDILEGRFFGLSGTVKFLQLSPSMILAQSAPFYTLLSNMRDREGVDTFIFSNESIFQDPRSFIVLLNDLNSYSDLEVHVIGYMRNPKDWIGSAYSQWGIFHKTATGPIPSLETFAPELLAQYEGIRIWLEDYDGQFHLRLFSKGIDVVSDFCEVTGIDLPPQPNRALESKEVAELVLRREFNNLFHHPVLPQLFDEAVTSDPLMESERIEGVVASMSESDGVDKSIQDKADLWDLIQTQCGIDLLASGKRPNPIDVSVVKDRVLDYLVAITMSQAKRIYRLELMLKDRDKGIE